MMEPQWQPMETAIESYRGLARAVQKSYRRSEAMSDTKSVITNTPLGSPDAPRVIFHTLPFEAHFSSGKIMQSQDWQGANVVRYRPEIDGDDYRIEPKKVGIWRRLMKGLKRAYKHS